MTQNYAPGVLLKRALEMPVDALSTVAAVTGAPSNQALLDSLGAMDKDKMSALRSTLVDMGL
jgi:hypothetical protein